MSNFGKSSIHLTVVFLFSTALIFFTAGLVYKKLAELSENSEKVASQYQASINLESINSKLNTIEINRRNYLWNRDDASKTKIHKEIKDVKKLWEEVKPVFLQNPVQKEHVSKLDSLISKKENLLDEMLVNKPNSTNIEQFRRKLLFTNALIAEADRSIQAMMQLQKKQLEDSKKNYFFTQKHAPLYIYLLSLVSIGLLVFAFYKISTDLGKLQKANRDLDIAIDSNKLAEQVGKYGVWYANQTTGEHYFSENIFRLLGCEPHSFPATYQNFIQYVHPEDLELVLEKTRELNCEAIPEFSYRIIKSNGEIRLFRTVARKMLSITKENVLIGLTKDITDEMENQRKLETMNSELSKKNARLSITNETYSEAEVIGKFGTWQWFIEENRFYFSDNLIRLFGFEPDGFEHKLESFLPAIHPEDLTLVQKKIGKMYEKHTITPFSHRIYKNNTKELRYININSKTIHDDAVGKYFLVITKDVTEEVKGEQEVLQKNRILEMNNKELEAFNYIASHDLQEPLRKIETFISRLNGDEVQSLSENGKNYMVRITKAAERMRNLINDLLQFSRSTKAKEAFEEADLNELLSFAKDSLSQKISEKNAKFIQEKLPSLEVIPFQIQQLFTNLLSNSLKYSKVEIPLEIRISASKVYSEKEVALPSSLNGMFYKIVFTDNGIGFPQEYAEKIFNLFTRLHGKKEYDGTGLGLSICKKIVENHKGFVFAHGIPGKGTSIIIYLPA